MRKTNAASCEDSQHGGNDVVAVTASEEICKNVQLSREGGEKVLSLTVLI